MVSINRLYRKAFTLVEMLVVFAIIGILASLTLPGLRSAFETAKSMSCLNNLKQQGMAAGMYFSDYRNKFPFLPGWKGTVVSGLEGGTWQYLMAPYVDAKQMPCNPKPGAHWVIDVTWSKVLICPQTPITDKQGYGYNLTDGSWVVSDGYRGALYYHYMEKWTGGKTDNEQGIYSAITRMKPSYFSRPSQTPFRFCSDMSFPDSLGGTTGSIIGQGTSWHFRNGSWGRPVLFIDGRAVVSTALEVIDGPQFDVYPGSNYLSYRDYGSYNLRVGNGNPTHKPWDYWIDNE